MLENEKIMGFILDRILDRVLWIQDAASVLSESEVLQKIGKTRKKLMDEEDYDVEEATNKAWKERSKLIRPLVTENCDLFDEIFGGQ